MAVKSKLSTWLVSLRRKRSAGRVSRTEPHFNREALEADLSRMNIRRGDTLFVHSSMRSIGFVEGGAATVIGALQEAVGPNGTVVVPTFYMPGGTIVATCALTDYVFDARTHGTHMGRIPEEFLRTSGIFRSVHPTHSVSAWGRHARFLTESHHKAPSIFGLGSPWQRLLELDSAKIFGLGVSMGPITFYHVLEDSMGSAFPLNIWEERVCHLPCVVEGGGTVRVPVRPFLSEFTERRIDQKSRQDLREYFRKEFDRAGLRTNGRVGNAESWFIEARAFFLHLKALAEQRITIYSTADELVLKHQ